MSQLIRQPPVLSRRSLIKHLGALGGAAALPGLLSGCGKPADTAPGMTSLRTVLAWINNVEYAGLWVALENGFYEEEGLAPLFLPGGPNAPMPTVAVAARDANIGFENDLRRFIDAVINGNDFVLIGAQYQRSPGAVLSLVNHPIRKPEDLVGIRFLGQEGVQVNVDAVLTRAGLPLDYTFVPAGFTPDPLVEGEGVAYSCFAVNQPIQLQEKYGYEEGKDYIVTPWEDLGLPGYANLLFVPRPFLDSNFDDLVGFLRATIRGWELNNLDTTVAARLAVEKYGAHLGLDLMQQERQNALQVAFMQSPITKQKGLFWLDADVLGGEMYEAIRAAGRKNLPPADRVVDTSVLEAAYGGRTSLLT